MSRGAGRNRVTERGVIWAGRLDLPPIVVPTEPEPIDPKLVGPLIELLGPQVLAVDQKGHEEAVRQLSLIDDPRVIPWYVKAMAVRSSSLKGEALGRLSRFTGDEALAGVKFGMTTQGKDIDNCTTPEVAAQSADGVRHSAALALARSPHPQAKALLWTMADDTYHGVRLTVIQTAAGVDTAEAVEVIKRATGDGDKMVRDEAVRLLKDREAKAIAQPH